jgi:hypothetical protein
VFYRKFGNYTQYERSWPCFQPSFHHPCCLGELTKILSLCRQQPKSLVVEETRVAHGTHGKKWASPELQRAFIRTNLH